MRRLPPLNPVRTFEAAARHSSFNNAAQELHVTPSAVSHQVRQLEEFLGVRLFRRMTRKVRLTPEGEAFLPPVSAALAQIETAAAQVGAMKSVRSTTLTLSVTPSFAAEWLVMRLSDFQARHPNLEVRLVTDHRLPDFTATDMDVAILPGRDDWPGLRSHQLVEEQVVPICAPALLAGDTALRAPEDLRRATLIHVWNQIERWPDWLSAAGVEHPDPGHGPQVPTTALALEAAESGLGVALANRLFVESHLATGRLAVPFEVQFATGRGYYLVYPDRYADRPGVEAFRDWLLAMPGIGHGPRQRVRARPGR